MNIPRGTKEQQQKNVGKLETEEETEAEVSLQEQDNLKNTINTIKNFHINSHNEAQVTPGLPKPQNVFMSLTQRRNFANG